MNDLIAPVRADDFKAEAHRDPWSTLFQRYAAEMVQLSPEALVAEATPSVEALRQQTSTLPIVFVLVTNPVGQGFVQSLTRPGGNITGFSNYDAPMAGKWLSMLTQITPPVARVETTQLNRRSGWTSEAAGRVNLRK